MVVPRHSTAGLVARYIARQLISCLTFYALLRILGSDPIQHDPVRWAMLIIIVLVLGGDRLYLDLRANKDVRKTLQKGGDVRALAAKWARREVIAMRVYALLGGLIGFAMLTDHVNLPDVDAPNWLGYVVIGIAIFLFVFARRLASPPSVESMVVAVLPPGFSESK